MWRFQLLVFISKRPDVTHVISLTFINVFPVIFLLYYSLICSSGRLQVELLLAARQLPAAETNLGCKFLDVFITFPLRSVLF